MMVVTLPFWGCYDDISVFREIVMNQSIEMTSIRLVGNSIDLIKEWPLPGLC